MKKLFFNTLKNRRIVLFIFIFLLIFVIFLFLSFKLIVDLYYPEEYRALIIKYSSENDIDPLLIASIIYVESHYNPIAKSKKGALGLMQIMPTTAKYIVKKYKMNIQVLDLTNPEINLMIGCKYMKHILLRHNYDYNAALAEYNAGVGNIRKWKSKEHKNFDEALENYGFEETKKYVKKVNIIYKRLKLAKKLHII